MRYNEVVMENERFLNCSMEEYHVSSGTLFSEENRIGSEPHFWFAELSGAYYRAISSYFQMVIKE